MAWNPDIYNKFKNERYAPFYDLLKLCQNKPDIKGIDLGCGTGELTRKLSDHLTGSEITGIDSSKEMLEKAEAYTNSHTKFICRPIQDQLKERAKFDLIFSNAALQWLDNHHQLVPDIISLISQGGQLAIQVPSNHDHFTHVFLRELAGREPYKNVLTGKLRKSPVLSINEYAQIFYIQGASENIVYEKVYPHIVKDSDAIYDWVSGTALIPYLESLPDGLREPFKNDYRKGLADKFKGSPVFYPFRRILMKATFCFFILISGFAMAQKNIDISDSLRAYADMFKVKLGSQGPGKILKMHFGEYAVVSSKMGWATGGTKANLFNTKVESKSTQKFSFILSNKSADSARVNAANNIQVKALQEIEVIAGFSWGSNELLLESKNFSAYIIINHDTTETWALLMHVARGRDSAGNYEAFLTNGERKIFISPVGQEKVGNNPFKQPPVGYEFFERGQSISALQYSSLTALKDDIVWINHALDAKMKLILAASMTAILQAKISEENNQQME